MTGPTPKKRKTKDQEAAEEAEKGAPEEVDDDEAEGEGEGEEEEEEEEDEEEEKPKDTAKSSGPAKSAAKEKGGQVPESSLPEGEGEEEEEWCLIGWVRLLRYDHIDAFIISHWIMLSFMPSASYLYM